jgi:energy-coupling factor transporter ATP-binding protein EcfA2
LESDVLGDRQVWEQGKILIDHLQQLLRVEGVSKSFAGVHALHEVSLAIEAGEVVCLAGENGSGKSTLVKILAGVVTPDAGTIEVDGRTRPVWQPIDAVRAGFEVFCLRLCRGALWRRRYRPCVAGPRGESLRRRHDFSHPHQRRSGLQAAAPPPDIVQNGYLAALSLVTSTQA